MKRGRKPNAPAVAAVVAAAAAVGVTAVGGVATVAVAGFTRPDGLNLLAVQQGPARYKLERYDLQGVYQATLATMARRASQPQWTGTCASGCGARWNGVKI